MEINTTTIQARTALAHDQYVQDLLLLLDRLTHLVYISDQAYIRLDENIFAGRIDALAFSSNSIPGILRTAHEVSPRLMGMFRERFKSYFTDATGCANEDGDETRWEGGRDERIGGLDLRKGNHDSGNQLMILQSCFLRNLGERCVFI